MNVENFNEMLEERIRKTRTVLDSKNKEYASDTDKLHNFKRASGMLQWTKHIISLLDIVDKLNKEDAKYNGRAICQPQEVTIALVEEKIGDAINYLILLEALIKERYEA